MIESILLKKIASYDQNGIELSDLKKVNFFFGANGSGKSTIAKYLGSLNQDPDDRTQFFDDCANTGFEESNHQILIYDEDFVEINFNRNPLLKGVFSLNETNDIIDGQITSKQTKINNIQEHKTKRISFKGNLENDKQSKKTVLLNFCWSKRNTFNSFTKLRLEYSGSKPNHLIKLKQVLEIIPTDIPTIRELTEKYNQHYEKEIFQIQNTINANLYREIRYLEIKLNSLLSKIIVGNEDVDIHRLIKRIDSRSWIESGLKFIDKVEHTCPFCQQETITESLKEQFNQYFDETSKEEIQKIKQHLILYKEKTTSFLENIYEIQSVHNTNSFLSNSYINLQQLFSTNIQEIESKILNSNERRQIVSLNTLKSSLSAIIKSINANNQALLELDQNKKDLFALIWVYMADKCKVKIEEFKLRQLKYHRINDLCDEFISNYDTELITVREEIENLRGQTVNTQDAVDNINIILKNSGFESFEIKEKDSINNISQYYLKRPNTTNENPIFKSLSEGEKSFISFLYFYQLCVGTDDIVNNSTKKKIIVFDDPVSSLDSQSLFVISSLIHQLILRKGADNKPNRMTFKNENIEQVFVLTHNIYFYKEVSFDRRPMCTDYWHYKISKINNITSIQGQKNKTITDDYALLWNTIKELKASLPQNSNLNVLIANSMRRIIESYVHFIGIGNDAWSSILDDDRQSPEYYLKYAFIASINDESHKVTALDGVYYQKVSSEQPQLLFTVFKEIFENIGRNHYEMMMDESIET